MFLLRSHTFGIFALLYQVPSDASISTCPRLGACNGQLEILGLAYRGKKVFFGSTARIGEISSLVGFGTWDMGSNGEKELSRRGSIGGLWSTYQIVWEVRRRKEKKKEKEKE